MPASAPGNAPADTPAQPLNPSVDSNYPLAQKTESVRSLFQRHFFKKDRVYKQWQADQAYLVLALANWAMLLWKSDWTTNLCCSGLHFTRAAAKADAAGARAVFLPSLHVLDTHVEPAADNKCTHHLNPKLKNIGLVLAESICAIPLRAHRTDAHQYEKWDGRWAEIAEQALLDEVKKKSSNKVRAAIKFCLDENGPVDTADGMASFYKDYVEKVFDPIKTWCDRLQDSQKCYYDTAVIAMLGQDRPDKAFQSSAVAGPAAPPAPAVTSTLVIQRRMWFQVDGFRISRRNDGLWLCDLHSGWDGHLLDSM